MLIGVTFKARVELILREKQVDISELARRAKLSRAAFYAIFAREKAGAFDLLLSTAQRIADFSGRPTAWVLGLEELSALAAAAEPQPPVDTLVLADVAASKLAEHGRASDDEAWLAMRGLRVPSPDPLEYYDAALKRLDRRKGRTALKSAAIADSARRRLSSVPPQPGKGGRPGSKRTAKR